MKRLEQMKSIGQAFKNQMSKHKSNARKLIAGVLTTVALSSCTGSLTQGAKADYLDGTTERLLEENKATYNKSVEIYYSYLQEHKKIQAREARCLANGDLHWARLEKRRATELKETIADLVEEIDELKDERLKLTKYENKGKKKAAAEGEKTDVLKRHFEKIE